MSLRSRLTAKSKRATETIVGPTSYDRNLPTTPGKPVVSNQTIDGSAMLTFTAASDNVAVIGYAAFLDGASNPWANNGTSGSTTISLAGVPAGRHTVVVKSYDAAGNYSPASGTASIVIPAQNPYAYKVRSPFTVNNYPDIFNGGNKNYTLSGSLSAPVAFDPSGWMDLILPAQAGDRLQFCMQGKVTTGTAGLRIFAMSIGGSDKRNLFNNGKDITQVTGGYDLASASTAYNVDFQFTAIVIDDDIDQNGNIVISLYGTNLSGGTVPATHTFVQFATADVNLVFMTATVTPAELISKGLAPVAKVKGPLIDGVDTVFASAGINVSNEINPNWRFVIPAKVGDIIECSAEGSIASNANNFQIGFISIGGSHTKNWRAGILDNSSLEGTPQLSGAATNVATWKYTNRVAATDLDGNGNLTLGFFARNSGGTGQTITLTGPGNATYPAFKLSAINRGSSGRSRILTASASWETGGGTSASLQNPCFWVDDTGLCNMLYTYKNVDKVGWATAPADCDITNPANWTKYAANPIIGVGAPIINHALWLYGVLYENGTLYVYLTDQANGHIYVAKGSNPLNLVLQGTPVVTKPSYIPASMYGSNPFKGRDGYYYMTVASEMGATFTASADNAPTNSILTVSAKSAGFIDYNQTLNVGGTPVANIMDQLTSYESDGSPGGKGTYKLDRQYNLSSASVSGQGFIWRSGVARCPKPDGVWTILSPYPAYSAQIDTTVFAGNAPSGYGTPMAAIWDDFTMTGIAQASPPYAKNIDASNPNFPTFLYTLSSHDGINWTGSKNPMMHVWKEFAENQVATPQVFKYQGNNYVIFCGYSNSASSGGIDITLPNNPPIGF